MTSKKRSSIAAVLSPEKGTTANSSGTTTSSSSSSCSSRSSSARREIICNGKGRNSHISLSKWYRPRHDHHHEKRCVRRKYVPDVPAAPAAAYGRMGCFHLDFPRQKSGFKTGCEQADRISSMFNPILQINPINN